MCSLSGMLGLKHKIYDTPPWRVTSMCSARWAARETVNMRKQESAAPPITAPTPNDVDPIENQSPTARSAVATLSSNAMPNVAARAAAAWRPRRFHSLHTGLATQQPETRVVPRGGGMRGGQPRCARGNLKEGPKVRTKMTKGKSGAKAPDRNRGRPPRMPPPRGTTYEVPNDLRSPERPTKYRTTYEAQSDLRSTKQPKKHHAITPRKSPATCSKGNRLRPTPKSFSRSVPST